MKQKTLQQSSLFLFQNFTLISFVLLLAVFSETATSSPPNEFCQTQCKSTRDPKLCYSSLAPYNGTIQNWSYIMVETSISVAYSKAHRTKTYLRKLSHQLSQYKGANPRVVEAVNKCMTPIAVAVSQLEAAVGPTGEAFYYYLNDIQKNLAMANIKEQACIDGWKFVGDDAAKTEVLIRVWKVQKFTGIASDLLRNLRKAEHI